MSTAVVPAIEAVDPPEVVRDKAGVDRTVSLQIEYRKKLRQLLKRHDDLLHQTDEVERESRSSIPPQIEQVRLIRSYRPMVSAIEALVRYASGLIENARLPQPDKIELQLRNSELEAELQRVRQLGI